MLCINILLNTRINNCLCVYHLTLIIQLLLPTIARFRNSKQMPINTHFARNTILGNPGNPRLWLLTIITRVQTALELRSISIRIGSNHFITNKVSSKVFETDSFIGRKTVVRGIVLHSEIRRINVNHICQCDSMTPHGLIRGRILHFVRNLFPHSLLLGNLVLKICNRHLDGIQSRHGTSRSSTQLRPSRLKQFLHLHDIHGPCRPDIIAKGVQNILGIPPSPQSTNGGHPRIIPSSYKIIIHKFNQPPLGKNGIFNIQTRHLINLGLVQIQSPQNPKIGFPPRLKFQSTN
mmetsp:Transcript_14161/g.21249  ORF Transcript_14161/g.21249 Transcript_14161/m.21249 type:complete len:291 (-) Transcript_14161:828-1700(-)